MGGRASAAARAFPDRHTLSERDELLLELLSHGLSDEQIGDELQLPVAIVRANIREAVDAIGGRNRAQAVALALKTGVFE
jgi:DNA-binding NarL/FixJ family response regulator